MNHCVPEFNMDDEDYSLPSASGLPRQKNVQEDEIMELLWQNGQVVVQSQNPRLLRKSSPPPTKLPHHHPHQTPSQSAAALPPPTSDSTAQLFMHEDEMISWLQYPLEDPPFDRDLIDLFYHSPMPPSSSAAAALKPPPPPPIVHPNHQIPIPSRPEAPPAGLNFPYFSRMTTRFPDSGPSTSSRNNDLRDSTVVDSSDTPAVVQKSKINLPRRNTMEASGLGNRGCNSFSGGGGGGTVGGTSTAGGGCMSISMSRDGETCELTLTSSPGGSGASATATADLMTLPPSVDRKRKGREPVDDATTEYQSEDVEIESYEEKKQARGANTKRSRAAEVHNQSERRRRDRINEKMKALQELIPRCSKTDKASMLDEAIEYLKSLQMQVQMMSMGCGMVPVMFPGVQQYMPSMGMGMGMGMTRHMMPFPAVLSGSGLPAPGAQMNPRFPFQAFPMQQTSNQADASVNPLGMPNLADPYSHQYIGIQHMPMQIPQTQPTSQPGTRQPSTSRGDQDDEKHQTG